MVEKEKLDTLQENEKEIRQLKKLYNILLKLNKKGETFFEDKEKSLEEKKEKVPRVNNPLP